MEQRVAAVFGVVLTVKRSARLGALIIALAIALAIASSALTCMPSAPAQVSKRGGAGEPKQEHALARACVPTSAETCFNARDDNCNGIIDEACGLATGLVQFVIAWNKPAADVDLIVRDPEGELVEVGQVSATGLVKERDCPGRGGECHGRNLENVFLDAESDPVRGTYRVSVRLENLHEEEPPVVVQLGARVGPKVYHYEVTLSAPEEERQYHLEL